jgi:hypothetical protein
MDFIFEIVSGRLLTKTRKNIGNGALLPQAYSRSPRADT